MLLHVIERVEAALGTKLHQVMTDSGDWQWAVPADQTGGLGSELVKANEAMQLAVPRLNGLSICHFPSKKIHNVYSIMNQTMMASHRIAQLVGADMSDAVSDEVIQVCTQPERGFYVFFQDTMHRRTLLCPPTVKWDLLRSELPGDEGEILELLDQAGEIAAVVSDHHWHDGVAGQANIVVYNGEDVTGIAHVADPVQRQRLIEAHNRSVDLLLRRQHGS